MNPIVTREEWTAERRSLLDAEKALTRQRDQLSERRRTLPWVEVEDSYIFDTEAGPRRLSELFGSCSQLVVYHFMYGPDWEEGCPSCSFWADNYNGTEVHLAHRDVTLIACSRAPLANLLAYRRRMGWSFPWVSSLGTTFNSDFGVSDSATYNYARPRNRSTRRRGSACSPAATGGCITPIRVMRVGLDAFNSAYQVLDLTPKGRDEDSLPWPMAWLRRHDQY